MVEGQNRILATLRSEWFGDALRHLNVMICAFLAGSGDSSPDNWMPTFFGVATVLWVGDGIWRARKRERVVKAAEAVVAMMDTMRDGRLVYFPPEKSE